MSYDIFLQRFDHGDAAPFDPTAVADVLDSLVVERRGGFARLETADGEADVYGLDGTASLMVNHATGEAIWDVLVDVATAGHLAILLGNTTVVPDERVIEHLPVELSHSVEISRSGADLLWVIRGS